MVSHVRVKGRVNWRNAGKPVNLLAEEIGLIMCEIRASMCDENHIYVLQRQD
jgi:hypothetical protein